MVDLRMNQGAARGALLQPWLFTLIWSGVPTFAAVDTGSAQDKNFRGFLNRFTENTSFKLARTICA